MVTHRSAKSICVGSIPTRASGYLIKCSYYSVVHNSWYRDYACLPGWWNGRHTGLKTLRGPKNLRAGSSPAPGTS